jgi:hypothetical protein
MKEGKSLISSCRIIVEVDSNSGMVTSKEWFSGWDATTIKLLNQIDYLKSVLS